MNKEEMIPTASREMVNAIHVINVEALSLDESQMFKGESLSVGCAGCYRRGLFGGRAVCGSEGQARGAGEAGDI